MSRGKGKAAARPAAHPAGAAGATVRRAGDGYANALAFLGESSPLLSGGVFERSELTRQTELLTAAYRESWLAKRIIDMPSEDMTRAWYTLSANLPEADLRRLKLLEARHSVKQELTAALRWARLYGGSLALMVIRGEEDQLDRPMDPDFLLPDCFQGLLVLDRAQGIEPSLERVTDLEDPDFGLPMYYTVHLQTEAGAAVRLHHSRVLRFVGRELPALEAERENGWGASELEHIWDELMKRSATSANIAQLVFQANLTTLKMSDFGELLAVGTEGQRRQVLEAVAQENRLRTSFGLQILSAGDTLETHSYSFSGLSEIYEAFMMDMAGAAEIPATKLFGRSPQGLNATGESDLRNYYEMIAQLQERSLRPDLEIVFAPLMTTSPNDRADLMGKWTEALVKAVDSGLLSLEEARQKWHREGERLGL